MIDQARLKRVALRFEVEHKIAATDVTWLLALAASLATRESADRLRAGDTSPATNASFLTDLLRGLG